MALDYSKLSDAELEAISAGDYSKLSDATLASLAGEPGTTGDYRAEAARKGLASSIATGLAAAGASQVAQSELQRAFARSMGVNLPETPIQNPLNVFSSIRESVYKPLMERFGSTGAKPETGGQRIVAAGIETATSPESYLFPGLSAVRRLGPVAQGLLRPVEAAAVGAGAEAGGMAGEAAGQKLGAPTAGQIVGSFLGGGVAQSAVGFAPRLSPAFNAAKTKIDSIRGKTPENELLRQIDNSINNIFIAASQADPKFASVIDEALKAQKSVSLKAPGAEAVELPVSAVLANNPVINSFIQQLSAKDPVFRSQYSGQFERAKAALTLNQMKLFGDPTKVEVNIANPPLKKIQERKIASIDDQIASLSNVDVIDPFSFGNRVSSLIAKKEDDARALVRPLYQEAFDIAKAKNVELPAVSVGDIYNFVAGEKSSDIFRTFPTIYGKVKSRFAPKEVEQPVILGAEGQPISGGVKDTFAPANIEDLDSLKREINRQLRKTNEPSEIRLLTTLKDKVNSTIGSLDEDFVNAYRNADRAYFQKIGLPFDSDTLRNVDRKKFVEQISPAIIGNKSNVIDFLNATGNEGAALARDAFIDNFYKSAVRNDVINPALANKWLEKNNGGISLLPGLEDELRTSVNNVQLLNEQKNRLNANFARVAGDKLLQLEGLSAQQLVNSMYGSRQFTDGFMRKYGANKDNLNAIRSFMLDDIVSSGSPLDVLNDRNKSAIFNRVFGPTYAEKVKDFAVASDRLSRDITNVPMRPETVPKTPIEQMIGVTPETILSRFYNPVSGPVYAISYIFSKYWAKQTAEGTENKLKQLLLNPQDAVKVMRAIESKNNKFDPSKAKEAAGVMAKYGIDYMNEATRDFLSGGARGLATQASMEE